MRVLVVLSHPAANSLCRFLAETATAACRAHGFEVRVLDLDADGFDPRLSAAERAAYYQPRYRSQVPDLLDDLVWAEALVLIFPTWWFGFPAALKGWFDRVFAPGTAYDHGEGLKAIRPRLFGLRRTLAVTTLGSPWWVDRFVLRRPVRRILRAAILGTCAPNCRLQFLSLYDAEKVRPKAVEAFARRITDVISAW